MKEGLVLIIIGVGIAFLSHPRISQSFFSRLANEGLLTPRQLRPEKTELLKYAGPHLSLFFVGVVLVIIGIYLLLTP